MLTRRRLLNLAALLALPLFVLAIVRLFAIRFETGDVFPPYSSLRTDPLGSAIWYGSLRRLPGHYVSRNKRSLAHVGIGRDTTLFLLGVRTLNLTREEEKRLEHFLRAGGRLVLTFFPSFASPAPETPGQNAAATPRPTPTPASTPNGVSLRQMLATWGVEFEMVRQPNEKRFASLAQPGWPLGPRLSWHSGIYFTPKSKEWQTVYTCEKRPVILERTFGEGSIVLAGDSFFVSNEALLVERHPALLAWLAGSGQQMIFDESHLDIREELGVVSLLRKYRLSGLVIAFLILVGLWLWHNASGALAFRRAPSEDPPGVSGRDSFSGLVTLLRRGIASEQLVETCLTQWRRSQPAQGQGNPTFSSLASGKDPVTAYNQLTQLMDNRKWKRPQTS